MFRIITIWGYYTTFIRHCKLVLVTVFLVYLSKIQKLCLMSYHSKKCGNLPFFWS